MNFAWARIKLRLNIPPGNLRKSSVSIDSRYRIEIRVCSEMSRRAIPRASRASRSFSPMLSAISIQSDLDRAGDAQAGFVRSKHERLPTKSLAHVTALCVGAHYNA